MKRAIRNGLSTLMAAMWLASCSIVVGVDLPKEGDDSDCAFLNTTRSASVTDCMRWQFNAVTLTCELGPLDEDNDGFFPSVCLSPDGPTPLSEIDCNDDRASGATAFPGASEVCDGDDNDCDTRIDEGVLWASLSDGPTITFSADPADLACAVDPVADNSVGIAYSLPGQSTVPGVSVRARDLASEMADRFSLITADANNSTAVTADPSTILSAGIGIAPLGDNAYAVAFINSNGGRRRVIAGVATEDRAKTLFMETSVFSDGLPCTADDGDCSVTRPAVDRPIIGVSGTNVLVATVRRSRIATACDPAVTEVNVVGNALTRRDFTRVTLPANGGQTNFPALRPTIENPLGLPLGMMRADASPAVIGLGTTGFVVALPQLDNTILLRTVTVTSGVFAVDAARDVTLSVGSNDLALLEPSLALGTYSDDAGNPIPVPRQLLAVAFSRACGGPGRVHVKFFDVAPTTGTLSPTAGESIEVDGQGLSTSIGESRPSVTFAPEQDNTWFVTFAKRKGWQGRVLSFQGVKHGGADSYPLTVGADSIGLTPVAFSMPSASFDSPRYGAMFVASLNGDGGIHTAHLACPTSGD